MSVASTSRKQQFTLNGTTSTLTFTFRALTSAPTDIKVTVTAGGIDTDLVYTTDFTVAVNSNGIGGTVTLVSPSSVGSGTATVYRDTTNTQDSDYDDYNQFPANTVENDFDIRTLVSQEQGEAIDRILQLPISYSGTASTILPIPVASTVIGWNSAGSELENKTLVSLGASVLASQAAAEAGTENTTYMSPLRTAQAITAQTPAKASTAQAQAGSNDTTYMTPSKTTIAIAAFASSVPRNYRSQMYVMQASTITITVAPGILEVNGSAIAKTSNTTLTLSTASDWAGGSSLTATSTTIYMGVDASGNIRMHTTAPTHADYAVSVSAANNTKRFASWSGTVYRIIGWARLNTTGSGELDTYGVSNIADGAVRNYIRRNYTAAATGSTATPYDDTIPTTSENDSYMTAGFVATNINNKVRIKVIAWHGHSVSSANIAGAIYDSTTCLIVGTICNSSGGQLQLMMNLEYQAKPSATTYLTYDYRAGTKTGDTGTITLNGTGGSRQFGGVYGSFIEIEEIESELT